MNRTFRSPFRYPGGKNCIFQFVANLLEENDMIGINYAEPYAGGAGLALRLLMDEYVSEIYLNDLDPSIYAVWYSILKYPEDMCRWIDALSITIDQWNEYKTIQRNYKTVDMLDLAKSTLFLNRTNVSGVICGGPIGGMNQTGKYKIDARFNKDDLIKKIEDISRFSNRIYLSNQNGIDFLDKIESEIRNVFIYLDPPYYKKGSDLYMNAFTDSDHMELAKRVKKLHALWMVSYDNHEFILNQYKDDEKVLYQLSQCASNRIGDEILIFDHRLEYEQSIKKLKAPRIVH